MKECRQAGVEKVNPKLCCDMRQALLDNVFPSLFNKSEDFSFAARSTSRERLVVDVTHVPSGIAVTVCTWPHSEVMRKERPWCTASDA